MKKRFIPIFLLMILSVCITNTRSGIASASNQNIVPEPVRDISFTRDYNSELEMFGIRVPFSIRYQSDAYKDLSQSISRELVLFVIKDSWRRLFSYLELRGIQTRDCRGDRYNINLFFVTNGEMNKAGRWEPYYYSIPESTGLPLYGYYDATHDIPYNSAIVIRKSEERELKITIAHEMAHYWWDRLCLSSLINQSPETYAQSFEREYRRTLR